MAGYVDPGVAGPDRRARPRHRAGDRGAGRARHRSGAARAGRVQSGLLPAAAPALSRRHRGAGRRLQSQAHCSPASCTSRRRRSCPACRCSPSRCKTRLRLLDEAFALMQPGAPFVQFTYARDVADPEGARSRARRGLRAHLAEHSAGARVGLPQGLTTEDGRQTAEAGLSCPPSASIVRTPTMSYSENPGDSRLAARRRRTTCGWPRSPPRS